MQSSRSFVQKCSRPAFAGLLFFIAHEFAWAGDASDSNAERETLVAVIRQLDLAHRLADQAATASSGEPARYHFDYVRLREDLQRVRAGVEGYLAPQRAQPRDPVPLTGSYSRDSGTETQVRLP